VRHRKGSLSIPLSSCTTDLELPGTQDRRCKKNCILTVFGHADRAILDEILRKRTNGNGYFKQEWDHSLFKRDSAQLVAAGRFREVLHPPRRDEKWPGEIRKKWYRDLQTDDTYE
jgi:hypothetical protein